VQQVVAYLEYSGRDADVVVTAALGPSRPTTLWRSTVAFGALRTWTDFHRATIC